MSKTPQASAAKKKKRRKRWIREAVQVGLVSVVMLIAGLLVVFFGPREVPAPAQPEPEEPREPMRISFQTTVDQAPWSRLADLRRVTLNTRPLSAQVWLEYPVFREEGEGFQRINAFFQTLCDGYFSPENTDLVRALEEAWDAEREDLSLVNTASVEFSGVGVTVTLDWDGREERYVFRSDTGERLDPSEAVGEEFSGLPPVPELEYRTAVTEDREAGLRRTVLDAQGLDLSVWFEVPVFEADTPGGKAINAFFQELSHTFFSSKNKQLTQAWEYAAHPGAPAGTYRYERSAQVRCRTEKLVSVTIDYTWFLGGREDHGSDSYTFRAGTGAQLRLADLTVERPEELKGMIRAAAEEWDGGRGKLDLERLERYALDHFEFYVEDGAVWIAFDEHELTGGESGSFALKIPAAIREDLL